MSKLSIVIFPEVGSYNLDNNFIKVDFPDPDWPTTATNSPELISSFISPDVFNIIKQVNKKNDDFYDDSGCYTFEIEVTNQYYAGDTATTYTSSNSWELDWNDDDSTQDAQMTTC